jgi:hypothetical protein
MSQEDSGVRALYLATSDRYSAQGGGSAPVAKGLGVAAKSGGGIFLVNPQGESTDNESLLADLRKRGVDEVVWSFTEKVFAECTAQDVESKGEL